MGEIKEFLQAFGWLIIVIGAFYLMFQIQSEWRASRGCNQTFPNNLKIYTMHECYCPGNETSVSHYIGFQCGNCSDRCDYVLNLTEAAP